MNTVNELFRPVPGPGFDRERGLPTAYLSGLWCATVLLECDLGLTLAAQAAAGLPATHSCYLIDAAGIQIGPRVFGKAQGHGNSPSTLPDSDAGTNHVHTPGFCNAMSRPGKIRVSDAAANQGVTLSTTVKIRGVPFVLCMEIDAGRLISH